MNQPRAADLTRPELESLLRWYVDMGVDLAVDDAPHDRFAEGAALAAAAAARALEAAESPPAPAPSGARAPLTRTSIEAPRAVTAASLSAEEAALTAQALAARAQTLDELRAALDGFESCGLKRTAKQLVFADGEPTARLMLVGEAPGGDEDREGKPFVGRAGRLLDRMLAAIGLDRSQVYIANIVPWRPPGNRTPTPQEIAMCLPFVLRQIELVNPDHLVCLGAASTQTLLGVKEGITKARGRAYELEVGDRRIPAFAMLHPAYLLRQPLHKKLAWRDLRALRKALDA